jgi:hypothetical protein
MLGFLFPDAVHGDSNQDRHAAQLFKAVVEQISNASRQRKWERRWVH